VARLVLVISSKELARNLLSSGGVDALLRAHDCAFIASRAFDSPADQRELTELGELLGYYDSSPEREQTHALMFDALMWRHRDRSRTFRYRWLRTAGVHRIVHDRGGWIKFKSALRWAAWIAQKWSPLRTLLFGSRILHPLVKMLLVRRLPPDEGLRDLLQRSLADLVMYPTNAYEGSAMDLVRVARELPTRTLFVVDNWDNLSSKTLLWMRPDHLAVWGEQTREHAIEIQGMPSDAVSVVGTARFNDYYAARVDPPPSPYPYPYVLFVGAAPANDELAVLRLLDVLLEKHCVNLEGGALRVVYRPHPWQHPRAVEAAFDPDAYRHVVLDRQLLDGTRQRVLDSEKVSFQPDLDWYPALLTNAHFVMGPLTTMLLEGSVCRRRVLALAHDDGIHFTAPSRTYRWYRHFEGIEGIEGFEVCHDLEDLPNRFLHLARDAKELDAERVDRSVDRFVHHDGRPFSERLLETVDRVLAQPPSA